MRTGLSRTVISIMLFAGLAPRQAPAQSAVAVHATPVATSGIAAADSAAVARAAWERASRALAAKDAVGALREVSRAARAWPTQPAYLWGRIVVAAQAADTAQLLDALRHYADLGLGRDLRADPRLASFATLPAFDSLAARHDANRAPFVRSTVRATFADSGSWPEGVDHDPRTGRFYLASIARRTVVVRERDGREHDLIPRGRAGALPVLAVRVDTARGLAWVTESPVAQAGAPAGDAALLRVRLADGAIERRYTLPASARGHTLGDVALASAGDVLVSDSDDPALYRLRPGADTLERLTSPLFRSLQGIATSPGGRIAYVADYSHGLLRVDLASGEVERVAEAAGVTALGCDGIAWYRGSIVAVQNGVAPARVVRFALSADGRRITGAETLDRHLPLADEPTMGAIVGDRFVYVANSQWEKRDRSGAPRAGAALTAPVLLELPLSR